jgi:hypothetical protein
MKIWQQIRNTDDLNSLTHIEYCIWFTAIRADIFRSQQAAAEVERLQRIEQAYIKGAMYAEQLRESQDDEEKYWGIRFYKALDAAALKAKP